MNTAISKLALVLTAAVLILVPYGLFSYSLPIQRDSGVFIYTGMVINSGGAPYLDSWDHKGPILYLLNALGVGLGGLVGVTLLQGAVLFAALLFSMCFWRRLLIIQYVLITAVLFSLTYYTTFVGGNLTESWQIPFSLITYTLAVAYFYELDASKKSALLTWLCVALGGALAIALLTRPNNGAGLAFLACYLIVSGTGQRLRALRVIGAAFAAIFVPVIFWLYYNNAFGDFVEQYLTYNFFYIQDSELEKRTRTALKLCRALLLSPLGLFSLAALVDYIVLVDKRKFITGNISVVILMMAIFAVELVSQLLPGKGSLHYASLTCASLTLVLVTLFKEVVDWMSALSRIGRYFIYASFLIPTALINWERPIGEVTKRFEQGIGVAGSPKNELVAYLREHTHPSDLVLVHGKETWLLAAANVRSPSSITYFTPARERFKNGYEKYTADVLREKPVYIVEAPGGCGLARSECVEGPELFSEIRAFLLKHYVHERDLHGYSFWRYQE